jgi:uncharacterized protein
MNASLVSALIVGIALMGSAYLLSNRVTTISTAPSMKTLQTSADGKVKVTPDTVVISAGVELHNRTTQEIAYKDMNTSINAVKTILKDAGIEEKNIQTSSLYVSPEYSYTE